MSGRGRNSKRRGLLTTMVNVRMTTAELEKLDALRRCAAPGHRNMVRECRADVVRRLVSAAVGDISNQVDPRQVTLDQAIARARISR